MQKLFITLLFFAFVVASAAQQPPFYTEFPPLPEAVTNNAVVGAMVNDTPYVYSFCGLDHTLIWSGIHLKAWRLNLLSGAWQSLPPVPDPAGGKIAAAASHLKGLIYVVGGYHVDSSAVETSSATVHRFDPVTLTWLTDAAPLPKAVDDQVQAVWRDSLLFVVTGWSNSQNVPLVQVYNPATNTWQSGTPTPNNNNFKAFGASGVILGDTIFYCGGAGNGVNFAATTTLRKGYIHPDNPTEISWTVSAPPQAKGYRMAAAVMAGHPVWIGGSDKTYNYDGKAYDGSGGVPALHRMKDYDRNSGLLNEIIDSLLFPAIMDLRGAAQIGPDFFVIAGGMGPEQKVSKRVYGFQWAYTVATHQPLRENDFMLAPNPADQSFQLLSTGPVSVVLTDPAGHVLSRQSGLDDLRVSTARLPAGLYFLHISADGNRPTVKRLVVMH